MKALQVPALVLCLALAACAKNAPPAHVPEDNASQGASTARSEGSAPEVRGDEAPKQAPAGGPSEGELAGEEPSASEAAPSRSPLEDGRSADRARPLPLLTFRSVGMHVGGGTNTKEEKLPYLRAIEARGRDLLLCYRLVTDGANGGTFGIDIVVPLEGGAPELGATRQKLGGAPFDDCMRKVMSSVRFAAPTRRTAISYSLRFDLAAP